MKKFSCSYDSIVTIDKLLLAWEKFQSDKKNRADVDAFRNHLMDNLYVLHKDLIQQTYRHGEYHSFNISDPKPRIIHKASVRDRLVHHLLCAEMSTHFDASFIHDSYSCRIDKGTHKAMNRFREFAYKVSKNNTRTCWVLKCDIRKFFASIDHMTLKDILARRLCDKSLQRLLFHIIDSFSTKDRVGVGLPLGNLTSQLLVNIYMNEFDHFVKRKLKTKRYIRYADDFVILHKDRSHLVSLISRISAYLEDKLKLSLHPNKLYLKTLASGVDFLGWVHFSDHRVLRTSTKKRMMKALNENPEEAVLASYLGMLGWGNAKKLENLLASASRDTVRDT